ncbi:hypothetical protein BY996DRAFT_6543744, partial [Phakopsora pachyrhizi]
MSPCGRSSHARPSWTDKAGVGEGAKGRRMRRGDGKVGRELIDGNQPPMRYKEGGGEQAVGRPLAVPQLDAATMEERRDRAGPGDTREGSKYDP